MEVMKRLHGELLDSDLAGRLIHGASRSSFIFYTMRRSCIQSLLASFSKL